MDMNASTIEVVAKSARTSLHLAFFDVVSNGDGRKFCSDKNIGRHIYNVDSHSNSNADLNQTSETRMR